MTKKHKRSTENKKSGNSAPNTGGLIKGAKKSLPFRTAAACLTIWAVLAALPLNVGAPQSQDKKGAALPPSPPQPPIVQSAASESSPVVQAEDERVVPQNYDFAIISEQYRSSKAILASRGSPIEIIQLINKKKREEEIAEAIEKARKEIENRITYVNGSDDPALLEQCAKFIAKCEGKKNTTYLSDGKRTIGYGHNDTGMPFRTITDAQALAYLAQDLKKSVAEIDKYVVVAASVYDPDALFKPYKDGRVIVNKTQYVTLVDIDYNMGSYAKDAVKLQNFLKEGDFIGYCDHLSKCVGGDVTSVFGGLIRRRAANIELCLCGMREPDVRRVRSNKRVQGVFNYNTKPEDDLTISVRALMTEVAGSAVSVDTPERRIPSQASLYQAQP